MCAGDEEKCKQVTGPVIITVHGTFAGNLREEPPHHWWQSEATLARQLNDKLGGIAVSTLQEADYFASHGFGDIQYAV